MYYARPGVDGPERHIQYDQRLEGRDRDNVIAHEVGHAIDRIAQERTGIPLTGSIKQFNALYHVQNSGGARTSVTDPPSRQTRPEHLGYRGDSISREKMAEGMRLYLQNPAYIKEHFPNAARRIREYVNTDPRLNRTIQFNEIGAPLGLGALGASGLAPRDHTLEEEDEDERGLWGWR
ncbi:Mlc titration factor MtfA (ptsG expression regulator) [Roseospira visakhapatnamensis]|uniref:Mlc titration factor MtfA (PtsG expression regulator) n=1 Tax=Roseospira visakhapatnamensis TaxID=390880 RepID=A0A7W6WBR1_9PROT|nr:Mlc titration factor MtfA (ptsG expression regulator) [Roseospira visakhapatnamensis]